MVIFLLLPEQSLLNVVLVSTAGNLVPDDTIERHLREHFTRHLIGAPRTRHNVEGFANNGTIFVTIILLLTWRISFPVDAELRSLLAMSNSFGRPEGHVHHRFSAAVASTQRLGITILVARCVEGGRSEVTGAALRMELDLALEE